MAKEREEIDSDFIARPAQDSNTLQFPPRHGLRATDEEVSAPAVFDERRIRRDLERLAQTPSLFGKYITVLKSRFTKSAEVALLNQWIAISDTTRQFIEARSGAVRAQHEHLQLEREFHIKDREKDLRLTELDADVAEAELRRMRAQYAAYELRQSLSQPGRTGSSPPANTDPQSLEQWYKQARQGIIADHSLSVGEQDQLLAALRVEYQQRRRGIIDI
jgi:hypothetical protein